MSFSRIARSSSTKWKYSIGFISGISLSLGFFTIGVRLIYRSNINIQYVEDGAMKDKIAIITGGSEGIGKETALKLAQKGARVIIGSRKVPEICLNSGNYSVADMLPIEHIYLDLSDFDSVNNFTSEVSSRVEKIDLLINTAAIFKKDLQYSKNGHILPLQVNCLSQVLLTFLLLEKLIMAKGHVLNIGCTGVIRKEYFSPNKIIAQHGYNSLEYYNTTKHLMKIFSLMFNKQMNGRIRVNWIDPGHVRTSLFREGPLRWLLQRPLYYFCFSSLEEAAQVILNVTALQKFSGATGKQFHFTNYNDFSKNFETDSKTSEMWNYILYCVKSHLQ